MTEALMPYSRRRSQESMRWSGSCGGSHGVEVPVTVTAENHASRPEILNREAMSVKFKGTVIVASELANR